MSSLLSHVCSPSLVVFMDTPPTSISTLSLHDALPICHHLSPERPDILLLARRFDEDPPRTARGRILVRGTKGVADRKSTRLNSSHLGISYAVFCLKKKKKDTETKSIIHREKTRANRQR